MKTNKKYFGIGILLALVIFVSGYASAFAVSSAYWSDNPLILNPGESRDIKIILQNVGGSEDLNVKRAISTGINVLEPLDSSDVFTIPAGGRTEVNFKAQVPADAQIEDVFHVDITFTTIASEEPGTFGFGSSISQKFDIIAGPLPMAQPEIAPSLNKIIILLIAAVIVLVIIIWFIRKRARNKISDKIISRKKVSNKP